MTNIHDYAILPKDREEAQQLAYHLEKLGENVLTANSFDRNHWRFPITKFDGHDWVQYTERHIGNNPRISAAEFMAMFPIPKNPLIEWIEQNAVEINGRKVDDMKELIKRIEG